jgi:uncharacterized protein (DUF427 family)
MKAVLGNHIVAQSSDITEADGYSYFPPSSVRLEWLEKAPKTADDLKCPHGVDGKRRGRAAWSYEKPLPKMQHVGGRFGFWGDVTVS